MKRVLVLDNYDSFTYNLVHIIEQLGSCQFEVHRNDKIAVEQVKGFDKILLSPGPGIPTEAGNMPAIVKEYAASKSILGVCLGHQCIGEVFGAKLVNMGFPMHGKTSVINVTSDGEPLFNGLPRSFVVGRYHSWLVERDTLPDCIEVTAVDEKDQIMALRHKNLKVCGVQFHPESIMTEGGVRMIENWLAE